jgi:hypothetical protein
MGGSAEMRAEEARKKKAFLARVQRERGSNGAPGGMWKNMNKKVKEKERD